MPPQPSSPTIKILGLALVLVCFFAASAFSQEILLTPEQAEQIRQNARPMPFPDISQGVITHDPVEFIFKYDLADRPPLAEWTWSREKGNKETASTPKSKSPSRINETTTYPYSSVVHLYMKYGEYYSACSGAFAINDYTVLTAGHCLYSHDTNSFAEEVWVVPGQDGEETPFGMKAAYNWATSRAWSGWEDYSQDWGVILIEPFAGNPGSLDTYYDSDDNWYFTHELDTAGYPGAQGYDGNEMWWDRAYVDEIEWGMLRPDFLFGTGDYACIPGQSGSAIYYDDGMGTYSIVAVLTLASCHGPMLDAALVDFLTTFDCTGCWIQNTCYDDGDVHPSNMCKVCDVKADRHEWSDKDGVACDDGLWCTGQDSCSGGYCSDHTGDPCGDNETCDEKHDMCTEAETDDDDNEDAGDFCQTLLGLTYDACDLQIIADSVVLAPQEALELCEDGNGPWDCINECAEHEDVGSCADFASCLKQRCNVSTTSGSGGDDDDGGGSGFGCGSALNV